MREYDDYADYEMQGFDEEIHFAKPKEASNIDLIKRLFGELRHLTADDCCDHSVGICYCSTFQALDDAKAVLDRAGASNGQS